MFFLFNYRSVHNFIIKFIIYVSKGVTMRAIFSDPASNSKVWNI